MFRWIVLLFLLFCLASGIKPCEAERYSVLIGINHYIPPPDYPWDDDLTGCINDVASMKRILAIRGFPSGKRQRILLDKAATARNICDALDWLARTAKPGDAVAVFYSGHGDYYPSQETGPQCSGQYLQAICPADFLTSGLILDTAIHDFTTSLLDKNVKNITIIFDSCFSGTADRGVSDSGHMTAMEALHRHGRQLKPVPQGFKVYRGSECRQAWKPNEVVFLSGCQPWQVSLDSSPTITNNGPPYKGGMFTSNLYLAMEKLGPNAGWRDIMREVSRRMSLAAPEQRPYAEGPLAHLPFRQAMGHAVPAAAPGGGPRWPVDISLTFAEMAPAEAADLRDRLVSKIAKDGESGHVRLSGGASAYPVAIAERSSYFGVYIPVYSPINYEKVLDFDALATRIEQAAKFLFHLRQMAALSNPASRLHVHLTVAGGPSLHTGTHGVVNGSIHAARRCFVQLFRVEPSGTLERVDGPASRTPKTGTVFHTRGDEDGEEILKVIATTSPVNWRTFHSDGDIRAFLKSHLPRGGEWDEDEDVVYAGDWTRMYRH